MTKGDRAGVGRVLDEETKRGFGSNFKDREVVGTNCGCDVWKQTETGLWRRDRARGWEGKRTRRATRRPTQARMGPELKRVGEEESRSTGPNGAAMESDGSDGVWRDLERVCVCIMCACVCVPVCERMGGGGSNADDVRVTLGE
jgi:hypothetical protein